MGSVRNGGRSGETREGLKYQQMGTLDRQVDIAL